MVSLAVSDRRSLLVERRDQALRDLVELDVQVAAGEISSARARQLRDRYEAEAAHALERLAALDEAPQPDERPTVKANAASGMAAETPTAPGRRRRIAGIALATVVVLGVALAVGGDLVDRPAGGFVTGNVTGTANVEEGGRDLSQVTNAEMEEVVAANPDIVAMRLRLAHRYFDDGAYDKAVDHYMAVLERADDPEAMSHLGWMLFLDGELDLAVDMVTASLERAPEVPETVWFLANIRLYGQQDPAEAVPLLESLLARDDLGASRADVEQALADARELQTDPDGSRAEPGESQADPDDTEREDTDGR